MAFEEILKQVQEHREKQSALNADWERIREKTRQECIELIGMFGFTASDLNFDKSGNMAKPKVVNPGAPKFQNPDGPETWTGRGKRPRWYINAREAGFTDEDMLIK